MQLTRSGPGLGQRVMMFNQRTQQDFDDVLNKLAGEPSLPKEELKAKVRQLLRVNRDRVP